MPRSNTKILHHINSMCLVYLSMREAYPQNPDYIQGAIDALTNLCLLSGIPMPGAFPENNNAPKSKPKTKAKAKKQAPKPEEQPKAKPEPDKLPEEFF